MIPDISNQIKVLEEKRIKLLAKQSKLLPWLIIIPILLMMVSGLIFRTPQAIFIPGGISAALSMITYYFNVGSKFSALKRSYKRWILASFMKAYYPEMTYNYQAHKRAVKQIVKSSGLIYADEYHEEDVITGKMKDNNFYVSEIKLKQQSGKQSITKFDGLLFRINIPGKAFPKSTISSKSKIEGTLFAHKKQYNNSNFYFNTNDETLFQEKIGPYIEFIEHLVKEEKDVHIEFKGNQITLLLSSNIKLFDQPKPAIGTSFINEEYYMNLGVQVNTLFYIIQAFTEDLDTSRIEEKLELKVMEYADNIDKNQLLE